MENPNPLVKIIGDRIRETFPELDIQQMRVGHLVTNGVVDGNEIGRFLMTLDQLVEATFYINDDFIECHARRRIPGERRSANRHENFVVFKLCDEDCFELLREYVAPILGPRT